VSGAAYYICPRCGRPIDHLERKVVRRIGKDGKVHEQVYFYARHYARGPNGEVIRVNGQPIIEKKCYLGPEKYIYASKLHAALGLQLKGLIEEVVEGRPRLKDYLDSVREAVERQMAETKMSSHTAQELASALEGLQALAARLRQYAEERAKAEAEAKAKGAGAWTQLDTK
jgi:hypothetical protein